VLRHRRGQEALETLLIFVAGLSVLSLTVGWGVSRYYAATHSMELDKIQHTGYKIYMGINRAMSRGEENVFRFNLDLPNNIEITINNNGTDLWLDYSKDGGTVFHIFKRPFTFTVQGENTVKVKGNQDIFVRYNDNTLSIECITREGELCPAE